MLSALKKLRSQKHDAPPHAPPPGRALPNSVSSPDIQTMSRHLQRQFARGVHCNMKVVIRGDTGVGKTSLWRRLQALPFTEHHVPTPEIQVASVQWSYKVTDEVIKLEVWDVVDRAQKRRSDCLLKLENRTTTTTTTTGAGGQAAAAAVAVDAALDAEFLDVYKGAHCVLLMLDVTKPWTLDYVRRQLECIPPALPVLVMANRCDATGGTTGSAGGGGGGRVVSGDQVRWLVDNARQANLHQWQPPSAPVAPVDCTDCSMRSGFGMRALNRFLSVPFLMLQRQSLHNQLTLNASHIAVTMQELQLLHGTAEVDFEQYLRSHNSTAAGASRVSSSASGTATATVTAAGAGASHSSYVSHQVTRYTAATTTPPSAAVDGTAVTRSYAAAGGVGIGSSAGGVAPAAALCATNSDGQLSADQFCPDMPLDASFLQYDDQDAHVTTAASAARIVSTAGSAAADGGSSQLADEEDEYDYDEQQANPLVAIVENSDDEQDGVDGCDEDGVTASAASTAAAGGTVTAAARLTVPAQCSDSDSDSAKPSVCDSVPLSGDIRLILTDSPLPAPLSLPPPSALPLTQVEEEYAELCANGAQPDTDAYIALNSDDRRGGKHKKDRRKKSHASDKKEKRKKDRRRVKDTVITEAPTHDNLEDFLNSN